MPRAKLFHVLTSYALLLFIILYLPEISFKKAVIWVDLKYLQWNRSRLEFIGQLTFLICDGISESVIY